MYKFSICMLYKKNINWMDNIKKQISHTIKRNKLIISSHWSMHIYNSGIFIRNTVISYIFFCKFHDHHQFTYLVCFYRLSVHLVATIISNLNGLEDCLSSPCSFCIGCGERSSCCWNIFNAFFTEYIMHVRFVCCS